MHYFYKILFNSYFLLFEHHHQSVFKLYFYILYCFSVPLELPIITREHFNRWYSLRAYYIAMTLADVPIQVFCSLIYLMITYYMTSQPWQFYRFGLFVAICLMVVFVAQALGLFVGALFSVKVRQTRIVIVLQNN